METADLRLRLRRAVEPALHLATLLALGLLAVLLHSLTLGVAGAVRGLGWEVLLPGAILGLLVGWGLAGRRMSGWSAAPTALITGMLFVFIHVGNLGKQALPVAGSLGRFLWGLVLWRTAGSPDLAPIAEALVELSTRVGVLELRLRSWLISLASREAAFDPVAAALLWSLVLWSIAAWAAWHVRRRQQPLLAMLPAAGLLAVTLAYSGGKLYELYVMLGGSLLLMTLVRHESRHQRWETEGTDYPDEIGRDLGCASMVATLAIVLVAAVAPSISVRRLVTYVQELTRPASSQDGGLANSLGLQQRRSSAEHPFQEVVRGGLPRSHLIGSGPELSEQIVMAVTLEEPGELVSGEGSNLYWRSLTYDQYTGRGWRTGSFRLSEYPAGEIVTTPDLTRQRVIRQEVRVSEQLGGLLFAAGELVTADQDFSVGLRHPGDLFGAAINGRVYRADSLVPRVSEERLRTAGEEYPVWVQERFLQLPPDLPSRVISLAFDLTATEPTPYDRARAIERYLRTFTYTLDVPFPPINRDLIDYFLFTLQMGYCDYYATSMVILARAAGIPARLAVGYIGGTYNPDQDRYYVSEAEAHSWVEVYFPEIGWIPFEPTAGRPALDRDEVPPVIPPEFETPPEPLQPRPSRWSQIGRMVLIFGLVTLGLLGFAWVAVDYIRLKRLPPAKLIAVLYHRLWRYGKRLQASALEGETPYEFADSLGQRVDQLTYPMREAVADHLSPAALEARQLAELVVLAQYSPHPLSREAPSQARRLWRHLSWRLLLLWISTRLTPNRIRPPAPVSRPFDAGFRGDVRL